MYAGTCILLDATEIGAFERFQFEVFSRAMHGIVDVFLLSNKEDILLASNVEKFIAIPNDEIFGPNGNAKGVSVLIPGNPDVKLLHALQHESLAKYDRFVRIEFDVVCAFGISDQLTQLLILAQDHDFCPVSFFRRKIPETDSWPWWKTFNNRYKPFSDIDGELFGGMLQICSFNRKFEHAYRRALADGWTAHYEVLMPTIAMWNELSIFNLGRTPLIDYTVFGVHPPAQFTRKNSSFFHPVKNFAEFARLPPDSIRNYLKYVDRVPEELRSLDFQ